jgi:hypothetical protein
VASLPEWAVDAGDIPDSACLLRRVPPSGLKDGQPDSGNFRNREVGFGLSVTVWTGDADLQDVLRGNEHCGVVTIVAADARALGLIIARAPLEGNPNHCELFPAPSQGRRNLLRNACEWVVYPEIIPAELRQPVVVWHEDWQPRIPAEEIARVCQ